MLPLALLAIPALAQLSISPDSIDVQVSGGPNALPSINVGNGSGEPVDFKVELVGYSQGIDGSTEVLEPDSNPLSALSYIKFDPAEFHLEPGQKQGVDLIASIPEGIDGGRYAILLITTNPTGGAVKTVIRLGVPIRLTIAGSHLDRKGTIKLIEPGSIESSKPIPIKVTYANEGNVHYKVQISTTISNAQGGILGKVGSESAAVLPGYSRQLISEWIPAHDLQPGIYNVLVTASLEDGTVLDEAQGSFEVQQAYVPPAPSSPVSSPTTSVAPSPTPTATMIGNQPPSGAGVNWPLIGGIVAGVIVVALLFYFLAVRRRSY